MDITPILRKNKHLNASECYKVNSKNDCNILSNRSNSHKKYL